jgi:hypothetical protein
MIGANGGLSLLDAHLAALGNVLDRLGGDVEFKPLRHDRDDVRNGFDHDGLHLIYLYCHGEETPGAGGEPCLVFRAVDPSAQAGRITAAALDNKPKWINRPLVILNGCGTVGFSPKALSPFVSALVRNRWASGVLGTEVPVYECLAGEIACLFLERFLVQRSTAGDALLDTRRVLLARSNPLGLVYTLYALSDLTIEWKASAAVAPVAVAGTGAPSS